MKVLPVLLSLALLTAPALASQKKVYHRKGLNTPKVKKGGHRYVRYPVRVNVNVNTDKLKIEEMIRDMNE
ncbi:MAG: hypothetical protein Q9N26_03960 [Aquificota bacterium]|nr:hypothetical protein [Aquificota bacterium]